MSKPLPVIGYEILDQTVENKPYVKKEILRRGELTKLIWYSELDQNTMISVIGLIKIGEYGLVADTLITGVADDQTAISIEFQNINPGHLDDIRRGQAKVVEFDDGVASYFERARAELGKLAFNEGVLPKNARDIHQISSLGNNNVSPGSLGAIQTETTDEPVESLLPQEIRL